MARPLRALLPWALFALLGALSLAWLGLIGFVWTDYELEAAPALDALTHGYVSLFLQLCPAYGGSLIMRAPFALAAHGLGGGDVAVFRAVGLPCLLAGAVLGVSLAASLIARSAGRGTIAIVVGLCAANPITLRALDVGHPEELLGAALSAGAVLVALRGRPTWAGVLLGLAVANKAWALLAVGPGAARAARPALVGARDRVGRRARVHAPAAAGRAAERPARRPRGGDRRDLPAVAGVVVLRLARRRDPRRRRADQGGLSLAARLGDARSATR